MAKNSNRTELSIPGVQSIVQGLRVRLPHLSENEREEVIETILDEVGKRLRAGEDIAFVKQLANGKARLQYLDINKLKRRGSL